MAQSLHFADKENEALRDKAAKVTVTKIGRTETQGRSRAARSEKGALTWEPIPRGLPQSSSAGFCRCSRRGP